MRLHNANSEMILIEPWRHVFLPEEWKGVSHAQAANIVLGSEMKYMSEEN